MEEGWGDGPGRRETADATLSISDRIPNGWFVVRSVGKNSNHDEQMDEPLVGRSNGLEEKDEGGGERRRNKRR